MSYGATRQAAAECLGTLLLVCTVVGSGIMAESLTRDGAVALLGNTLPTGAMLVVLITLFGPMSGAHFNPAVTAVSVLRGECDAPRATVYMLAQVVGGIGGTILAHSMFALPLVGEGLKVRTGPAQWLSEGVATFGLIAVVFVGGRLAKGAVPWLVGLYITAAYWFTASTAFANPAVSIARAFTQTFSGIRLEDLPGFVAAQFAGALAGGMLVSWLLRPADESL